MFETLSSLIEEFSKVEVNTKLISELQEVSKQREQDLKSVQAAGWNFHQFFIPGFLISKLKKMSPVISNCSIVEFFNSFFTEACDSLIFFHFSSHLLQDYVLRKFLVGQLSVWSKIQRQKPITLTKILKENQAVERVPEVFRKFLRNDTLI